MSAPFIVLEGLDGVGKTTIKEGLARHLGAIAMDCPGPVLRQRTQEIIEALEHDVDARLLFFLAANVAIGRNARRLADAGQTVILDRYVGSTLAYGRAFGATIDVASAAPTLARPDVTILLVLDDEERKRRIKARGIEGEEDTRTQQSVFRQAVLDGYRAPKPQGLGVTVEVDVTGADPDEAVRRVLAAIRAHVTTTQPEALAVPV